jgi:hypothetical protein
MKNLFLFLTLIFISKFAVAQESQEPEYYNEINLNLPYLSSLKALLLKPSETFQQNSGQLTMYPERQECDLIKKLGYNNQLIDFKYKLQPDGMAPLIFIIPGTGGDAHSPMAQYFAMLAYRAGYSVVELISTTNSAFSLAASSTGRTGYLPRDAKDYYELLKAVKTKITDIEFKSEESLHFLPRSIGLLGYSYGGLDIGFLLAEDVKQQFFNFDFAVLLNTPFSRDYAVERVDQYDRSFRFDQQINKDIKSITYKFTHPLTTIKNTIADYFSEPKNYFEELLVGIEQGRILIPDLPGRLEDLAPISSNQGGKIIASAFRADLAKSAYAADIVRYCRVKKINPNSEIPKPNAEKSMNGTVSLYSYLENGALWEAAIEEASLSVFSEENFKQIQKKKRIESDLEYAIDKVYAYHQSSYNTSKIKPIIKIFHAQDDYLTFGQNSPANRLIEKWAGYQPGFIEITSMSQQGGHMGQFADNSIIRKLYRTLLELKR